MNHSFLLSKVSGAALAAVVAVCLSTSVAQAQTDYYFDPGLDGSGSYTGTGSGGSGVWDTEMTADWVEDESGTSGTGAGFDTVFPSYTDGPGIANFDNAGGNVEVTTAVSPYQININVTDGVTENIGVTSVGGVPVTGEANQITIPVGNGVNANPLTINSSSAPGTEDVVFNSNLNLNILQPFYNGLGFNSYSSGNLEFNGGITFSNSTTDGDDAGIPSLSFSDNVAGGSVTINSAVTLVNLPGSVPVHNAPVVRLNSAGTMTLTTNASFTNTTVAAEAGTVIDLGASYLGGSIVNYQVSVGGTGQYLTGTAGMDVSAGITFNNGGGTLGSALAAETSYSAPEIVGYNGTNDDLTSAAGGRVDFTGDVHNGNGYSIVKVGAGTVNLDNSYSNSRGNDQTGGYEIQNGTLLVDEAGVNQYGSNLDLTGSGVTIDNVTPAAAMPAMGSTPATPQMATATLGGVGTLLAPVTANGALSTISPGDPEVANAAGAFGVGTLTLTKGLTATSGMTFAMDLDGARSNGFDTVEFAGSTLSLAGPIIINFDNLGGALDTGVAYDIFTDFAPTGLAAGDSSLPLAALFELNAPAGYTAVEDPSDLLPGATSFAVDFEQTSSAIPEPSTWALMLAGMAVLGFCLRRRIVLN